MIVGTERARADELSASFVNTDTTICDQAQLSIDIYVNIPSQSQFTIQYKYDGSTRSDNTPYSKVVDGIYTTDAILFEMSEGSNYEAHTVELVSLYSQADGTVELSGTYTVYLYATPTAEILTDSEVCGYGSELLANNQWSAISTYSWETDGGTLTNADSYIANLYVGQEQLITATLTETTGGKCVDTTSKQITYIGSPSATLTGDDIVICSNIDDPAFDFEADIYLTGHYPFTVDMTNGQQFTSLSIGTTTLDLNATQAQTLTVASITDTNGCSADADSISGEIIITDRKPNPTVSNDTTTYTSGKDIAISGTISDSGNTCLWKLASTYADYDAEITYDQSEDALLNTNMNGFMALDFIETNNDGTACPDTATLYLTIDQPLFAPDGFSPNGDGVNDYFVIEGLPAENHVMVCDAKGKVVFEQDNYRNDWAADDLEDGYYVCIYKGLGSKTVKQTIVIKRSK